MVDTIILDGKGRGIAAGVNADNRLLVSSETALAAGRVSLADGRAFNLVSEDDDAAAADLVLYLKNDDTERLLFIDIMRVASENAATFKVWSVTGTAAGSSALTPVNMNLSSGLTALVTARGDGAITGLTTVGKIAVARVAASTSVDIPFDDILILGVGDAIAVEYDTGTTGDCEVLVRMFFRKASAAV